MKRFRHYVVILIALWGGLVWDVKGSSRLFFSNRTAAINLKDGASFSLGSAITNFNGMLIKDSNASISGSNITFSNGSFEEDGSKTTLSATLNPTTDKILLNGSKRLRADPGIVFKGINVSGSNNRLEGQPVLTGALTFDANATLTIALNGAMNQNIQFDAGGTNTLLLEGDLFLTDDVTIVNDGTIDVNGRDFWFGGKEITLTNDIYWLNAGAVNLTGRLNQSGRWAINSETTVNGHGNVLDISAGYFDIKASTTLHLVDMFLAGVKGSTFVTGDDGSTVRMSNVTMQLIENSTYTQGLFYIDGPGTVYLPNYTWALNGNSELTVSAVTLWKDRTGSALIGDITGNLTMVYNGTCKAPASGAADVSALESLVATVSWATIENENDINDLQTLVSTVSLATIENENDITNLQTLVSTVSLATIENENDITNLQTLVSTVSLATIENENDITNLQTLVSTVSLATIENENDITNLQTLVSTVSLATIENENDITNLQTLVSTVSLATIENENDITNLQTLVSTVSLATIENENDITNLQTLVSTVSLATIENEDLLKFIHGPRDYTISSNMTLSVNTWMSNDHVFTIGSNLTIDGDKHEMSFASGDENVISIGSNSLTLQNIKLKNFFPKALSVTTGSISFGDGTIIDISDNVSLPSTNYTMSLNGDVKMFCHGNEVDISQMEHAMDVQAGSTLSIYNARISGLGGTSGTANPNNLKCVGPDSTLTLSNCELVMENDFSFTEGYMNVYQDVAIRGPETTPGTQLVFAYKSPQDTTIRSLGRLKIDRNVTFSYDSDAASKNKIVMEDSTSTLHLNGCTLYSTHTGLQLTGGRLIVEDKVTVQNEAATLDEAMVLKDPLEVDVLSGGVFDLVGLLDYQ
jgi:hypothetical protein